MKRFATLCVLLMFLALSAQTWGAPQVARRGEILRAEYGYGNKWTDVSQRVFSLARGNVLSFRVDDITLGVTSRPGSESTLRIHIRQADGQTRQLTFRENQNVNLRGYTFNAAVFGGLRITSARYGTSVRSNDVTNRLNSQIRDGQLSMLVNNTTMGGDPDHDRRKTLTVGYTYNGRADQISVTEGGSLNLPSGTSQIGYNLQITRATYGTSVRSTDVTYRLNSQIRDGQLAMQVNNTTMGGDPDHDRPKTLTVNYTYNGRADQISVAEGGYLNLPSDAGDNRYGLRISSARYGTSVRSTDVTNRLNSQIRDGRLSLQVNNDTMGGDPDSNRQKTLTVNFTLDGRADQVTVAEGGYLNLPSGTSGSPSNLRISRARYGTSVRSTDVTDRLNSQIRDGQLSMQVNNTTMGGDPDHDRPKTLTVSYTLDGRADQVTVNEGDYLRLPAGYGTSVAQTVRCESANYRRNYCSADTRGGVRLTRQLGSTNCVRGTSWDFDQNGIWVDNGCRADFEVLSQAGSSWSQRLISNGTLLSIRTNEAIDSKTAREGQRFSAVMEADVLDNAGALAVPKGSDVQLVIRSTEGSDLVLDVDSIIVSGRRYNISTEDLERKNREGIGANKRTATMVGGGAAIGAIIGAIVGGGKGAAIGAAIGAAGGAGAQVLTKGKDVSVPSETVLSFRLEQDLYLVPQP